MQTSEHKSFNESDEVREFPHGRAEIVSARSVDWSCSPGGVGLTTSSPSPRPPAAKRPTSSTTFKGSWES